MDSLAIEGNEMTDTQIVDIDIVSNSLTGEVLTEIRAVGADGLGQLLEREVVLQLKLLSHTVFFQLLFDMVEINSYGNSGWLLSLWLDREFQRR